MKHKVLVILLISTLLPLLACADPSEKYMEQADTYFVHQQWNEAISEYTKAIDENPNLALAYSKRGQSYAAK